MAGNEDDRVAPWHMWERHRVHVENRREWRAIAKVHQDALQQVVDAADFRSWKDFYEADERRRGDDVVVGEVTDGELHWRICWHPRTQEVAGYGAGWVDERWHRGIVGGSSSSATDSGVASNMALGPARVPEVIYLLGHAGSADRAKERLATARDLNEVRASMLDTQ
jgi:hypothetical protein